MIKRLLAIFAVVTCCGAAGTAWALHPFTPGYVVESRVYDQAKMLHAKLSKELLELADDTEYVSGVKMLIVTIPALPKGWKIDYYAQFAAQQLNLAAGKPGVLLLFSKAEGQAGFSMGAELNRHVTNKILGAIVKHEIRPEVEQKDYQQAVRRGAEGLSDAVLGKYKTPAQKRKQYLPFAILIPFVVLMQVLFGNGMAQRIFGGGAWKRW